MESCFRCGRNEEEVKLLDAIYENDIVKICERCSIGENIPIIRKPSTSQLKESERNYTVYQRMKRLAGLVKEEKKTETILDKLKKLEENPELEMPEERKPFGLIDNFHWNVQRERRNKGLSQKQLGWALGESEAAIKMVEKAQLPEDYEKLIKKLEQFLQIQLIKKTDEEIEEEKRQREKIKEKFVSRFEKEPEVEEIIEEESKEDVSLSGEDELEFISSIASGKVAGEAIQGREELTPLEVLSFKPETTKKVTLADFKKIKEKQERGEKLVEVEEERKKALREIREKVSDEMKNIALGKGVKIEKKTPARIEKISHVPTIAELMERKKEREKEKMMGDEIELEE